MVSHNFFTCSTVFSPHALPRTSPRIFPGKRSRNGFTLVEIGIVLVIVALMLGFGVTAYMGLMETRKVASAQSLLKDAKACLLKRALVSERYPSYTAALTCGSGGDSTMDVDDCICPSDMLDPWGQGIRFLEGVQGIGTGLAGSPFVSEIVRGQTRVAPDAVFSQALDHTGLLRDDVAYVLISFGENTVADNTSYGNEFAGGIQATKIGGTLPDFQTGHVDDLYVVVTSSELATAVLE
jgi:prepilin-type N-terminal cleavage/methylation domain-containing protein